MLLYPQPKTIFTTHRFGDGLAYMHLSTSLVTQEVPAEVELLEDIRSSFLDIYALCYGDTSVGYLLAPKKGIVKNDVSSLTITSNRFFTNPIDYHLHSGIGLELEWKLNNLHIYTYGNIGVCATLTQDNLLTEMLN